MYCSGYECLRTTTTTKDHNAFKMMFVLVLLALFVCVCMWCSATTKCAVSLWCHNIAFHEPTQFHSSFIFLIQFCLEKYFSLAKGIFGMHQIGNWNEKMCTSTSKRDDYTVHIYRWLWTSKKDNTESRKLRVCMQSTTSLILLSLLVVVFFTEMPSSHHHHHRVLVFCGISCQHKFSYLCWSDWQKWTTKTKIILTKLRQLLSHSLLRRYLSHFASLYMQTHMLTHFPLEIFGFCFTIYAHGYVAISSCV